MFRSSASLLGKLACKVISVPKVNWCGLRPETGWGLALMPSIIFGSCRCYYIQWLSWGCLRLSCLTATGLLVDKQGRFWWIFWCHNPCQAIPTFITRCLADIYLTFVRYLYRDLYHFYHFKNLNNFFGGFTLTQRGLKYVSTKLRTERDPNLKLFL